MIRRIVSAAVEVIDTVAPYALAVVVIVGLIGFLVWIFERWNRESP